MAGTVQPVTRHRHAGEIFTDDDATIAAALAEVSVPALLCSLVHMTGDPSWIRGPVRPRRALSTDLQSGIPSDEQTEVRRQALPVVLAYRDRGCVPHDLPRELLVEMMAFLGCQPVGDRLARFFLDDLQFDGVDPGAVTWGDEVPADVRAASPVLVIGCGMAGILAGIRLRQAGLPFTIVDKNAGPGGTWWENSYPGARVDVASAQYCYPFEPGDHWSEHYCQQPELRDYFARIVDEQGLGPSCRFGTEVVSATWDDDAAHWTVRLRGPDGDEETLTARFLISAVGSLNIPHVPELPGMETFAGPSFHSARWPADLDVTGTRFALVGAGASGFQLGPAVAERVAHLTIFQRTAQWMLPNPLYHEPVSAGEQWASRHLPRYGRWMRFLTTFPGVASGVELYRADPGYVDGDRRAINEAHAARQSMLESYMTALVEDPELLPKVVPDYPAMGKRILQDNGTWLRTLQRPDVEIVRTGIERIVPDGIVTVDGTHHPADVICYATGFHHNDFLASLEVIGRDGRSLREQWGDEPTAYLGITIPNFPNLFCLYGPGTNLAHSASLFFHAETQTRHAMDAIHRVLAARARSIEVRPDVHDEYMARYRRAIDELVWAHPSVKHSHYKNPAGKVFTLSPWPVDEYWEWASTVDPDDYEIE